MIRPPQLAGAAFSEASDGDIRNDLNARASLSEALGVSHSWATVRQVHGSDVVRAAVSGDAGNADGVWTTEPGLPLAVFTADCLGVVMSAPGAVGVAHAGWRGALAGVVAEMRSVMVRNGHTPTRAAIGPGIGLCCFEVGTEVSGEFPDDGAMTTWGTRSVDLSGAILRQLDGLETWVSKGCTYHDEGWFSHRRNGKPDRLAAVGWL
ncbi:MAG: polyphenol oxidase family protein [Acidimicrobiia bacterium]